MRITEESGAKFSRRLSVCASRHIGAPYANLNKRYLLKYRPMTYEPGKEKLFFFLYKVDVPAQNA